MSMQLYLLTLILLFANRQLAAQSIDLNINSRNLESTLNSEIPKSHHQMIIHTELPAFYDNSAIPYTALKNSIENGLNFNQQKTHIQTVSCRKIETRYRNTIQDNSIGIEKVCQESTFIIEFSKTKINYPKRILSELSKLLFKRV